MATATPHPGHARRLPLPRVVVVGLVMVGAHAALRGWALHGGWFYADDYRLLLEAVDEPLSVGYLAAPFDSQFMPVGRLVAWLSAQSGPLSWATAACLVLALQVLAALACLRMVLVLFGQRWASLGLLAVYLTSVIPLTAFMWWAAALNAVPMQLAFFVAVTEWVTYLRTRRLTRLATAMLAVAFGLLSYVKAALILVVLAWVLLAYFVEGGPLARVRRAMRLYWPAAVVAVTAGAAYAVHYVLRVPQPFDDGGDTSLAALADALLGRTLTTGALGGPWRWDASAAPNVAAAPTEIAVRLAWLVIAATVVYTVLRRLRTGRAWLLLAVYSGALFVLLVTSTRQQFGTDIALQYRYLADAVVVIVLVVGLATLPLAGAVGSSLPRPVPLVGRAPRRLVVALVAAVCAGGVVSTVTYVGHWHRDDDRRSFVLALREDLHRLPSAAVADRVVPEDVVPPIIAPTNRLSVLVGVTGEQARFPHAAQELHVVTDDGRLRPGDVDAVLESGRGPDPACGWRVRNRPVDVSLGASVMLPGVWWSRIAYLSSADSPVLLTYGDTSVGAEVVQGLNYLYVRVPDTGDTVTVAGLDDGVTVCVDEVLTGPLVPASEVEPR